MMAGERFFKWALSRIGGDELQYPFIRQYIKVFMHRGLDLRTALDISTREQRDTHEAALRKGYEEWMRDRRFVK
jgi:hypothetical protein